MKVECIDNNVLSKGDLAKILRISATTLRRIINAGMMGNFAYGDIDFIRVKDVCDFLNNSRYSNSKLLKVPKIFLTIRDLCKFLGVSRDTIQCIVKYDKISFFRIKGSVRFSFGDIIRYCEKSHFNSESEKKLNLKYDRRNFFSIKESAHLIGVSYSKMQKIIKYNQISYYCFYKTRCLTLNDISDYKNGKT